MSKNKSLGDLNVSLASKTGVHNEPSIETSPVSRSETKHYVGEGFAAVSERLTREVSTRATIATTVRLPEESDRALKEACAKFGTSKADLMKVCVEEFLKANNFLKEISLQN
jgi:hypothetical protein